MGESLSVEKNSNEIRTNTKLIIKINGQRITINVHYTFRKRVTLIAPE